MSDTSATVVASPNRSSRIARESVQSARSSQQSRRSSQPQQTNKQPNACCCSVPHQVCTRCITRQDHQILFLFDPFLWWPVSFSGTIHLPPFRAFPCFAFRRTGLPWLFPIRNVTINCLCPADWSLGLFIAHLALSPALGSPPGCFFDWPTGGYDFQYPPGCFFDRPTGGGDAQSHPAVTLSPHLTVPAICRQLAAVTLSPHRAASPIGRRLVAHRPTGGPSADWWPIGRLVAVTSTPHPTVSPTVTATLCPHPATLDHQLSLLGRLVAATCSPYLAVSPIDRLVVATSSPTRLLLRSGSYDLV
jgi:hypothetical protein